MVWCIEVRLFFFLYGGVVGWFVLIQVSLDDVGGVPIGCECGL